ncbi:MAG: hypothetical protein WEC34_06990 [Acidimicrobiia bacterium]
MAKNPDPSLTLTTSRGVARTVDDWTTMFQLCLVVLPARSEASAFIPVAQRIFATFGDSDATCAYLVTGEAEVARRILGKVEAEEMTFVDPDGALVASLGIQRLPALVQIRQDTSVGATAEGWNARDWQRAVREIAKAMAWTVPEVSGAGDPPRGLDWPVATV